MIGMIMGLVSHEILADLVFQNANFHGSSFFLMLASAQWG